MAKGVRHGEASTSVLGRGDPTAPTSSSRVLWYGLCQRSGCGHTGCREGDREEIWLFSCIDRGGEGFEGDRHWSWECEEGEAVITEPMYALQLTPTGLVIDCAIDILTELHS